MPLEISPAGRKYGYIKNPPDHRDFSLLHSLSPVVPGTVGAPRSANKQFLGPVRDQGAEGSCTGHASSGNRDFLYNRFKRYEKTQLSDPPNFSPQFAYYMGRKEDGSLGEGDCGSTGRSVAMGIRKYGICLERDWPYVAGQFDVAPTDAQIEAALKFIGGAFHSVGSVQDIRSCLASKYTVMLGFLVWSSFEDKIGADGLMPTPDYSRERRLGGHETLIYDYDDEKRMGDSTDGGVAVRNSWGMGFGNEGDFWMSYKQLADPNIFLDATLQHLGRPWAAR